MENPAELSVASRLDMEPTFLGCPLPFRALINPAQNKRAFPDCLSLGIELLRQIWFVASNDPSDVSALFSWPASIQGAARCESKRLNLLGQSVI